MSVERDGSARWRLIHQTVIVNEVALETSVPHEIGAGWHEQALADAGELVDSLRRHSESASTMADATDQVEARHRQVVELSNAYSRDVAEIEASVPLVRDELLMSSVVAHRPVSSVASVRDATVRLSRLLDDFPRFTDGERRSTSRSDHHHGERCRVRRS